MADELDPELTRLFAVAEETLPPGPFIAETMQHLRRSPRLSTVLRLCIATAMVGTAAVVAPFVARVSVDLARYGGSGGVEGFADLLVSPLGVAGSLVVAFFVLRRIRALGR